MATDSLHPFNEAWHQVVAAVKAQDNLDAYWQGVHQCWVLAKDPSQPLSMRYGQLCLNLLYAVKPELTEQMWGSPEFDPFYNDDVVPAFGRWLAQNWEPAEDPEIGF